MTEPPTDPPNDIALPGAPARRRLGPGCASDLTLDQLATGELSVAERAATLGHIGLCAACGQAHNRLQESRATFASTANLAALAADALSRAQATTSQRRWLFGWAPRLALPVGLSAAAVVMALALLMPSSGVAPPDTRTKGGFSLSTYVKHPDQESAGTLHLGEPLHPGDRLQFRYNGSDAGFLTVVAVDGAGQISIYFPPGETAQKIQPGRDLPLPSAVELDGTLGREIIVAVRCAAPIAVSDVVAAARRAQSLAGNNGRPAPDIGPLGLPCVEARQEITKIAQPKTR